MKTANSAAEIMKLKFKIQNGEAFFHKNFSLNTTKYLL